MPSISEDTLPIQFSPRERDLIVNLSNIDLNLTDCFNLAVLKDDVLVVKLDAGELEELLGSIEHDANHAKEGEKKLQKELYKLFDRLDEILNSEFPED